LLRCYTTRVLLTRSLYVLLTHSLYSLYIHTPHTYIHTQSDSWHNHACAAPAEVMAQLHLDPIAAFILVVVTLVDRIPLVRSEAVLAKGRVALFKV
jgi:hypothetical protein